ncbi:MAG: IS1634 family transposase [Bacteroidetes bacterium]|nr:MAG: IS1634 family transposase [Bacteroidota bacterium]
MSIQVQDLNHLGIVAGIIDEMGLVEAINHQIAPHPQQIVSTGVAIKAMILNGLGFVSAPLYLFEQFFVGKATEHLLGAGIAAEHLNDDRLGRALDEVWQTGVSGLFMHLAVKAYQRFGVSAQSLHLDSSSFSVTGAYPVSEEADLETLKITYGYSKDHRPDLKQFLVDIICSNDGDVPLFLRVGDGNESDSAVFGQLIEAFQQQWTLDSVYVADAALYTEANLQMLGDLQWVTRVPLTLKGARQLVDELAEETFVPTALEGYSWVERTSDYGGVSQRWVVVCSEQRRHSDLKQLDKQLEKQAQRAQKQLRQLRQQTFACAADAQQAAHRLAARWPLHQLSGLRVESQAHYDQAGRPAQGQSPSHYSYHLQAEIVPSPSVIATARRRAGRFILATNVLEATDFTASQVLATYKDQQSPERGFRFLKDPLFFTSSVFLNTPSRVAALAFVMGLALMVYTLAQRRLRQALAAQGETIPNQLGKPTAKPTLRWVFMCFQSVHLLQWEQQQQISNLTDTRVKILGFLGAPCQKYYLLC